MWGWRYNPFIYLFIYKRKDTLPVSVAARSKTRRLRLWVRIPPGSWMAVCCECCVLSGRGLCDELITRPEESYRLWCVVCDLETSWMRRPWPTGGGGAVAPDKQHKDTWYSGIIDPLIYLYGKVKVSPYAVYKGSVVLWGRRADFTQAAITFRIARVLHYNRRCNSICAHKRSTAFTTSTFTELTNAQKH